ncbi:MAG: serine/threonine protein kinase [Chitinispirillaceae bacterium]|nr:serine/threonine protein kinase [Chitinispirillaceae bacterium]
MSDITPVIKLALDKQLITEAQCDVCRCILHKGKAIGFDTTIEEILIKQGFIAQEQMEELRAISQLVQSSGGHFGPYRLGRLIGEGGMGRVYEALHEFMGRPVAIKIINQEHTANKTKAMRFFQEVHALIKLDHPNIVMIYDAGRVERNYYYAMEYLPGPSLLEYVEQKKMLPEQEALSIVRDIAKALGHAHANNVIHRDVKPENILFDRNRVPRLTDFGIAMHHDEHHLTLTTEGISVGSLHYTSPEQADGTRDIDCRADIYSLGATLYHLLTGRTVYKGATPQELLARHLRGAIIPPRTFNRTVSRTTAKIVKKMLAVDRAKRFQTMDQVIKAIEAPTRVRKIHIAIAIGIYALIVFLIGAMVQEFTGFLP